MLDDRLINEFRTYVNLHSEMFVVEYKNVKGKNLWNCICSCMDWIDIAVEFLRTFRRSSELSHQMSMNIYSFISAVDIIVEAIQQLDRAVNMNEGEGWKKSFKGQREMFPDSPYKDDDLHFKEIRAAFGAHPTSLRSNSSRDRHFASWSTNRTHGNYDYSVRIYDLDASKTDYSEFGFRFDSIVNYVKSRYSYLKILHHKLEERRESFISEFAEVPIERCQNTIMQMEIIQKEIENRRAGSYYAGLAEEIIRLLNAYPRVQSIENRKIGLAYLKEVMLAIEELYNNLQNMKLETFLSEDILNPRYSSKYQYDIAKVYNYISDPNSNGVYDYHLNMVQEYLQGYVTFDQPSDYDQVFLLLKAGLYFNKKDEKEQDQ